ncbi:hydrogenase nickel incorporation protein HypB [Microbacterium sp.]|uniref:hydrogenase nickel incorporation protein HypB n=1 Tax=Microbacterium sp. TaxID=51671 RepID=UPI0027333106|nr:hydrogenase nickel incorporation protein HypB [Microbacterium sp.]MDP3950180.1 hydrogenase nickel incorporation protein HypB [Microbacterium sp.]
MGRFHRHDDGTEHDHDHDDQHGHGHGDAVRDAVSEHGDHSAYQTGPERVVVLERIFDENDRAAGANRAALDAAAVVGVNMMSSPGAGKTAVLERTLAHLQDRIRAGVVEGDIETSIDADRLAGYGAQISLLNTSEGFGGECHLDAPMVAKAMTNLVLDDLDLVLVENVGNLVCPAEFDVGTHHSVMVFAITEGEEKPLKYPVMFRSADVVLVNKMDLLPHLDFDLALFEANLARINPKATVIHLSARTGDGMADWFAWLEACSRAQLLT